ncbi:MAG: hypothetical protein ACRDLK_11090, partial [Gaiellaceae bacterium]
ASLVRARDEERTVAARTFRSVAFAGLLCFALYTGVKAAYLSGVFATRVEERNLIYVAPLLLVGTALVLERRRVNGWALLASGAFSTYLVGYALYHPTQYPYEMNGLYSDSLGLSVLAKASSLWGWSPTFARILLICVALVTLAAVAAVTHPRVGRRLALGLTAALAAGVVGWSLSAEVAAASESNTFSSAFADIVSLNGQRLNWVDANTHGAPTVYEGVCEVDPNPENVNEFFNRSIVSVGSLDGTLTQGPGPAGAPNIAQSGVTFWGDTLAQTLRGGGVQYDYAVEDYPCVNFAGALVKTHWHRTGANGVLLRPWHLVRLTHPNRLVSECDGLYPDGWSGASDTDYYRFSGPRHGWLRIVVSRRDWSGPTPPSPVHVLVGKLLVGPDK